MKKVFWELILAGIVVFLFLVIGFNAVNRNKEDRDICFEVAERELSQLWGRDDLNEDEKRAFANAIDVERDKCIENH